MNTLRGDLFLVRCVAGLLTCGSLNLGGLPGFPVANAAKALTAHSCGGSHGIGPDWVVLTVFPVRPEVRLAAGTTQSCNAILTARRQHGDAGPESKNDTGREATFTTCQSCKALPARGF